MRENRRIIEKLSEEIGKRVLRDWNGAQRADFYVLLGQKLGLTHLLLPEARPDRFYSVDLPEQAPEKYADRRPKSEDVISFIRRVYAPWLGQGLARHHLRHLDETLYHALGNWLRNNSLPQDLDLPTKKELNNRELERLGWEEGETLPFPSYYRGLKDKLRLYNAARNRRRDDD